LLPRDSVIFCNKFSAGKKSMPRGISCKKGIVMCSFLKLTHCTLQLSQWHMEDATSGWDTGSREVCNLKGTLTRALPLIITPGANCGLEDVVLTLAVAVSSSSLQPHTHLIKLPSWL
jgi:hypothetical protein